MVGPLDPQLEMNGMADMDTPSNGHGCVCKRVKLLDLVEEGADLQQVLPA